MKTTDIIVLFLAVITIVQVAEANYTRIKGLDKRINHVETDIKDLQVEIKYLPDEIIAALKHSFFLPREIRQVIVGMVKSGDLTELVHGIKLTEVEAMKRSNKQIKSELRQVKSALSRSEQEVRSYKHSVKKFQTELHQLRHQLNNSTKRKMRCCEHLVKKFEIELHQLKHQLNNSVSRTQILETENRRLTGGNIRPTAAVTSTPSTPTTTPREKGGSQQTRENFQPTVSVTSTPTTTPREKERSQQTIENFSLLVARRYSSQFVIVNLMSSAITQHPIRTGKISDVVYHRGTERIMWSSYPTSSAPGGIFSARVDGSGVQKISSSVPWFMAIDSARSLLFCLISDTQIMSLDLTTRNETLLTSSLFTYIYQLAVHTGRRLLFVVDLYPGKIIQVNYNGEDGKVIGKGSYLLSLTVDEGNNILYYHDGGDIKRYSLRTSSVTSFLTRSGRVLKLVYFRHLLYIAVKKSNSEIYNLENNSNLTINTDFGSFLPAACFIPKIGDHS